MAVENFFDHKCNIFHLKSEKVDIGFGRGEISATDYPKAPDLIDIPCHFGVKSGININITQKEPQKEYSGKIKLTLPIDTDIRLNDKIIDCDNGLEYTAELPRNIRDNHIAVYIYRDEKQRPL